MNMLALLDWLAREGSEFSVFRRGSHIEELRFYGPPPKPKASEQAVRTFWRLENRNLIRCSGKSVALSRLDSFARRQVIYEHWVISDLGREWLEEQRAKRTKVEG